MKSIPHISEYLNSKDKNIFNEPVYRLVWSDEQTEKRKGYFDGSNYHSIREMPKYNYIQERWILEKWFPPINNDSIDTSRGTYEPVWVFEDKNNIHLEPTLIVIQIIIQAANGKLPTPEERKDKDNLKMKQEIDEVLQIIGE